MEKSGQFSQDYEKKANKKKPKPKKRWLLSRQYLQPLEEPEDEPDPDNLCDSKIKSKLKSICRSAFYGMKEGLLTGIFIGGCYGIFTYLNSSTFFDASGGGGDRSGKKPAAIHNQGGGVHPTKRRSPSKSRRKPTESRGYIGVTRRQFGSRSNSNPYEEKFSNYKTLEETIYGYTRETGRKNYSDIPFSNTKLNYSKLPVKNNKYLKLLQDEKKKYNFERFNDNVAIVGYAFVKTTGAFETESENISPEPSKTDTENKESGEETEEEGEEEEKKELDKNKSDTSGAHSSPKAPPKSSKLLGKDSSKEEPASKQNSDLKEGSPGKEDSVPKERSSKLFNLKKSGTSQGSIGSTKYRDKWKKLKTDISPNEKSDSYASEEPSSKPQLESPKTSIKSQKSGKIKNLSSSTTNESNTSSKIDKQSKDSKTKGMQKMFSSIKSTRSKSKQSVISESNDEQKAKPSRITIISPKQYTTEAQEKNTEQSSSVLIKSLEPDQSEISTRPTVDISQDSRVRSEGASNTEIVNNKTSKPLSKNSMKEVPIIIETEASDGNISKKSSKEGIRSKRQSRSKSNASQTRSSIYSENVYPSRNAPSYLVNAESVSNNSENVQQKVSHVPTEHETVPPKYSESIFSAEFDFKTEYDDVGYTGSNISEFPLEYGAPKVPPKELGTTHPPVKAQDSTARHEGSAQVVPYSETDLRHLSNYSLKTPKQSRSVVFSGSFKETPVEGVVQEKVSHTFLESDQIKDIKKRPQSEHSQKSGVPSEHFEKPAISGEDFIKSVIGSEQSLKLSASKEHYPKSEATVVTSQHSPKSRVSSEPLAKPEVGSETLPKSKVASDYSRKPSQLSEYLPRSRVASDNLPKGKISSDYSGRPLSEHLTKSGISTENVIQSKLSSDYSPKLGVPDERFSKSRAPSDFSAKALSEYEHRSKSGVPSYHSTRSEIRSEHLSKTRGLSEHSAKFVLPSQHSGKSGVPSYYSAKSEAPSEHSTKSDVVSQRSGKSAVLSDYSTKWSGVHADASAKSGIPTAISANWSIRSGTSAKSAAISDYSLKSTAISEHSEKSNSPYSDLLSESQEQFKSSTHEPVEKTYSAVLDDRAESSKPVARGRAKTEKSYSGESSGLKIFSTVTDNTIVVCACNCALVLGIICTVVSTTRASLLKI